MHGGNTVTLHCFMFLMFLTVIVVLLCARSFSYFTVYVLVLPFGVINDDFI